MDGWREEQTHGAGEWPLTMAPSRMSYRNCTTHLGSWQVKMLHPYNNISATARNNGEWGDRATVTVYTEQEGEGVFSECLPECEPCGVCRCLPLLRYPCYAAHLLAPSAERLPSPRRRRLFNFCSERVRRSGAVGSELALAVRRRGGLRRKPTCPRCSARACVQSPSGSPAPRSPVPGAVTGSSPTIPPPAATVPGFCGAKVLVDSL